MEGVGARLGRSSTRYGPATVFTGPVRRWKKKWVHVSPPNGASSNHHHHHSHSNGNVNGNNGSHLLLYKWTPINQTQNNSNGDSAKNDAASAEEPPRRKFKYIPIALLEEQKDEAAEQVEAEDEDKPNETDAETGEPNSKSDGTEEKPDINDVPMEENQAPDHNPLGRQDLNKSTLDLSLNLNSNDGENDSDLRTDQHKDKELERVNS